MSNCTDELPRTTTGTAGLDFILQGGLPRERIVSIHGNAGTGKTTLAFQFLVEGVSRGENSLYISFVHAPDDIRDLACSHGWDVEGIHIQDLSGSLDQRTRAVDQTIFDTSQMELGATLDAIKQIVESESPQRLVFDAVAEIRILTDSTARYQKQILSLKHFLSRHQCTVLLLSTDSGEKQEEVLRTLVDGVIMLEQLSPNYGRSRRRLEVRKMRGMPYHTGYHDFRIVKGGVEVFPRLDASPDDGATETGESGVMKSGVEELDSMLGGGLIEGSSCIISGAPGTGKSSIGALFAYSAAMRGERAMIFTFDESSKIYALRSKGLGLDIEPLIEKGLITLRHLSIGEISPGEFSQAVRKAVDRDKAKVLIIDSLSGYYNAMPEERLLLNQLHDLLQFTSRRGVLSLLTVMQHGFVGDLVSEPASTSLLADAVLLLRPFEAQGSIRRAISVFKKRYGSHDKSIREMQLTEEGIKIGLPLEHFSGVLTGSPIYHGERKELMGTR